jgi:hypothetical protein
MSTFTASLLNSNVKATHTGIVPVGAHVSVTATGTASSVVLLNFVPNGATLVDWWFRYQSGAADQGAEIGTSATPSGIMAMTTLSLTLSHSGSIAGGSPIAGVFGQSYYRAPMGGDKMPVRISLSDDAQPATTRIKMVLRTAISASLVLTWMLFYTMDGLAGRTTIR